DRPDPDLESEFAAHFRRAVFGDAMTPNVGDPARPSARRRRQRKEPDQPLQERINAVFARAALQGYFDPVTLADTSGADLSSTVISALASKCEIGEIDVEGRRMWILKRDSRHAVLRRLWDEPSRDHFLALAATELDEDDEAGRFLQSILMSPERIPPFPETTSEMRNFLQALDWASPVIDVTERAEELHRELAFKSLIESYDRLLKDGFFGRET